MGEGSFDGDSQQRQQQFHGHSGGGGGNMIMQEWLHKRSSSLQLVWKRRWCVLREDRLFFYRSNTDTKPVGMLHLSEYSILAAGPEISRKSKLAFRLSSPEPIPHQQQHHVFFTESAQTLHNWLYSLQLHINHATTSWSSKASSSTAAGLGLQQPGGAGGIDLSRKMDEGGVVPGQSIIDKVLDRLHLDDPSTGGAGPAPAGNMSELTTTSTTTTEQPRVPYIPPNFPQSHEDNNDTWSSTSSMPNTSTNTSTNLEYIFALNQQNQAAKSSMDSTRGGDRSEQQQQAYTQGSPTVSSGANHQPANSTSILNPTSSTGYAGSTFTDQSSVTSEANRFSMHSVDYQGRSSLHQPRPSPGTGSGFHVGSASPRMLPIRSSVHSGLSAENGAGSPSTSVAGSPYASPILSSQHPSLLSSSHNNSHSNQSGSASPRTFYRVLENSSPSKQAESIASSASISTVASSGDVSTINDINSENGLSSTATDSSQPSKPKSAGAAILGLVTGGGKHKKDKKEGSSVGSNHSGSGSGSGSSGLKLFGSGICYYSGCTQMAKTCSFHNKKFRPESPGSIASRKAKEEKKAAKEAAKEEKKAAGKSSLWSSSSDKSGSQGNISEISSPIMMKADGTLLTSYGGSGRGLASRSMVSLPRDAEFGIDPSMVPLPPSHLRSLASSPTRRRSPSVGVLEDSLSQQGQQQDHSRQPEISVLSGGGYSTRPQTPLSAAPSQPLPPPPPRAPSSASNHKTGSNNKETFSLSRKMGLQMGSEFGAGDKNALPGTALDGNYFVANHHRTMQKFQLSRKPQPQQQQQQFIDQQQLQQQQQQQQLQYLQQQSELFKGVGVSRHIVAPDELAMAIEMEAEEMRRRQVEAQEVQKSRPTSMVKGGGVYHSMPIQLHLATVAESAVLPDGAEEFEFGLHESKSSRQQDGGKIISAQEQMAYAPLEPRSTIESDRSPISAITAGISPLSPNPGSQLPPASSLSIPLSEFSSALVVGGGGSTTSSSHGSPRSNSLSAGSGVSSPGFPSSSGLPAPLSFLSLRQLPLSSRPGSRHPTSPMNASFLEEDRSEFHMRSLPPPKRHINDHSSKGDSNGVQRNGLPRRSSAAAAVTLSPTESGSKPGSLSNDQQIGFAPSSPSPGTSGTPLRPAYMARRQSSSPVLIRVSDQGGQNISPLLTGGATRTFAGDAPSREVFSRPSELTTPVSSVEGSPAPSASTRSSSMCSVVTSRYTGQDALPIMSPNQDGTSMSSLPSPTMVRGKVSRTTSSPLASVTPTDGCAPSASPAFDSVSQMPGEYDHSTLPVNASFSPSLAPYRFPAVASEDVPSVVVNSPNVSSSPNAGGNEPGRRVLHNASSFQFPAPSQDSPEVDSNGRPLSSCSSISSYSSASENFGAHKDEDHPTSMEERYSSRQQQYQQQHQQHHQQQRRGSNGLYHDGTHSPGGGMSPSLHAAALGLYPGLRKLSLFTAAAGDHPPPPLLSGRKGSTGSNVSTRDYHHGVTSPTLSTMEDGDEVSTEEEDLDLQNDEDWAGNMKSMRQGYNQDPVIVVATDATACDALLTVVVDSIPTEGLSTPPFMPLPLTPLSSTSQPPRLPTSSGMKAPPVVPGSYYFPASPSIPLPLTPPVSGSIMPIPAVSPVVGVTGTADKNPLALAVATAGAGSPPMIPPRSPHRSAPGSPTALRSMRSYQNLTSPPPPGI
ncbi:hypothetical protein BGZ96_002116 [Linnemannia gamsii]|uniref:PH domain-containing protein n=1 Tax=Linnemannia gamsii TaxID=64522 RepID=A0ABQ7K954_9FUNG|nr:hypothetical protein BGZ96_002116 [Linnemannia gamsii]